MMEDMIHTLGKIVGISTKDFFVNILQTNLDKLDHAAAFSEKIGYTKIRKFSTKGKIFKLVTSTNFEQESWCGNSLKKTPFPVCNFITGFFGGWFCDPQLQKDFSACELSCSCASKRKLCTFLITKSEDLQDSIDAYNEENNPKNGAEIKLQSKLNIRRRERFTLDTRPVSLNLAPLQFHSRSDLTKTVVGKVKLTNRTRSNSITSMDSMRKGHQRTPSQTNPIVDQPVEQPLVATNSKKFFKWTSKRDLKNEGEQPSTPDTELNNDDLYEEYAPGRVDQQKLLQDTLVSQLYNQSDILKRSVDLSMNIPESFVYIRAASFSKSIYERGFHQAFDVTQFKYDIGRVFGEVLENLISQSNPNSKSINSKFIQIIHAFKIFGFGLLVYKDETFKSFTANEPTLIFIENAFELMTVPVQQNSSSNDNFTSCTMCCGLLAGIFSSLTQKQWSVVEIYCCSTNNNKSKYCQFAVIPYNENSRFPNHQHIARKSGSKMTKNNQ